MISRRQRLQPLQHTGAGLSLAHKSIATSYDIGFHQSNNYEAITMQEHISMEPFMFYAQLYRQRTC